LYFDAEVEAIEDLNSDIAHVRANGVEGPFRVSCDYVAGCDGSFGISNKSIPSSVLRRHERTYPFSWLGVLAEATPATEELIYCRHERASRSTRCVFPDTQSSVPRRDARRKLSRMARRENLGELNIRLATDEAPEVHEGPIVERGITAMRSIVVEPMRYGRLLLAGDAAHIVPPTGAKGMNLGWRTFVCSHARSWINWFTATDGAWRTIPRLALSECGGPKNSPTT